jgi:hypothetical protein
MVTMAAVAIAFSGSAVVAPGVGLAQGGQGCATANAKGGPNTCTNNGSAPIGEREADCYRLGFIGMLAGVLGGGGAAGGLAGFGGGCAAGVTG